MAGGLERTWDGLPVAPDNPRGAMVVVSRAGRSGGRSGGREYLMLHRAHRGPDYEGDWAWTPPSGARLPGEPVLAGAWRELTEEAGLGPTDLVSGGLVPGLVSGGLALGGPASGLVSGGRGLGGLVPVDVSGGWAVLAAVARPDAQVRLVDAEHDAFAWLPLTEALRRCRPSAPADNLRRAARVPLPPITFRPLTRADLPDLVARLDLAGAERKYGPRIDQPTPTAVHVILADGQPCGFIQHYPVAEYLDAVGGLDAVGLDYAIGVSHLTGQGLGPQVIWRYLEQVVFPAWPHIPFIVASPDADNIRSIRVLEKAGFTQSGEIPGPDGHPETLCILDRTRIFGPPPPSHPT